MDLPSNPQLIIGPRDISSLIEIEYSKFELKNRDEAMTGLPSII